jgi:phage terminase large subunit GpA-like protein
MPGQDRKAVQRAKKKARKEGLKHKYMPVIVGTDGAKTLLFSRFAIERPGPGYCHFPVERDDEYYRQMTAERLRVVYKAGKARKLWTKIRERNEVLDCRVLAGAAIKILNPVWSSLHTAAPVAAAPRPGRRVRSAGIRR